MIGLWWGGVVWFELPPYLVPTPAAVVGVLIDHPGRLATAMAVTLTLAGGAFVMAVGGAIMVALLFIRFPLLHRAFFAYVIALQVTPVMALAPLILIWVGYERTRLALTVLAALVAFFPALVNTYDGLRRVDAGLYDLFRLYRARQSQILFRLRFPTALPLLLSGIRVSGNLALVGAVVAEFIAGSGTSRGLAWHILEAGRRLRIDEMFAALLLLALSGIAVNAILAAFERFIRRHYDAPAVATLVKD